MSVRAQRSLDFEDDGATPGPVSPADERRAAPRPALVGPRLGSGGAAPGRRAWREAVVVVAVTVAVHGLIASAFARPQVGPLPVRPKTRVRISVARPPEPIKPPVVPEQVPEPPKPKPRPARKAVALPPPAPPAATPPAEAPPPAPPVLATTAATEPGAVGGAADGSVTGTGVVGGVEGGTGRAPAPPAPPAPVVAAHEGANYLKNPRPEYPEVALRRGWEGTVLLRVQVGANGRPAAIAVKRSSGREALDEAAARVVKGWTFVPARQGTTPVAGAVDVPIVFKLQQE